MKFNDSSEKCSKTQLTMDEQQVIVVEGGG